MKGKNAWALLVTAVASVGALAAPLAAADVIAPTWNNLRQLGLGAHNGGNDLTQLELNLYNVSWFGDGSVRTLVGDGSVRTVSVGADVHASLCFRDVQLQRNVQDGTSNTILLSESVGLRFSGGVVSPFTDARGIVDGTSNTIAFPETTSVARDICFGNVGNLDPVIPPGITDGTSNTILIGERSRFDLCLSRAGVPTITDGTSNTIVFGETRTNACFYDIVPAADITVVSTVPEPTPLALIVTSLLALTFARRRPLQ
jgi:hypothetical protein